MIHLWGGFKTHLTPWVGHGPTPTEDASTTNSSIYLT
jgi:hypothetical protein